MKVDVTKFVKGTKFKLQYYMVGPYGEVYNKYWVTKTYDPDFKYSKQAFNMLTEDNVETNLEHLRFFVDNNRIKLIK